MNIQGKSFKAATNSENGSLDSNTVMHFTSETEVIVGTYGGGTIRTGAVLAKRISENELEMLYQGATTSGLIQAGKAKAIFEPSSGKLRMTLEWQWLTGDTSSGRSEWEQI